MIVVVRGTLLRFAFDVFATDRAGPGAFEPLLETLLMQPVATIRQLQDGIRRLVLKVHCKWQARWMRKRAHVIQADRASFVALGGRPLLVQSAFQVGNDMLRSRLGFHIPYYPTQCK